MKKLEIVIRPERVPLVKAILNECNVNGAMFSSISGYGRQKCKQYFFNGQEYFEQIFPKTKVEIIINDETVDNLIKRILKEVPTGEIGDGKIFIYDVANVVRIRTGETGKDAL